MLTHDEMLSKFQPRDDLEKALENFIAALNAEDMHIHPLILDNMKAVVSLEIRKRKLMQEAKDLVAEKLRVCKHALTRDDGSVTECLLCGRQYTYEMHR